MIELDAILKVTWHNDSKAGNLPAMKGEITKAKVVQHGNANSRNGLRCCASSSKSKATTTMAVKVKIKRERIMILSLFLFLVTSSVDLGYPQGAPLPVN